ncbi:hypothetical protein STAS_28197 [Striga asiatica]|uniref:Uncharacterized protein n=1 Tax=Striga asiatica TaxID=4170 RepID=A0A5A7QZK8_STRAF|nr:hypothetical protein STAS_28197 [Striga asiatica]
MTNQGSTKVRLVRCPKCRQVLAELPEVPLYKCGGCGTVLQAKNRRPETNSSGSSSQETCSAAKSQPDELLEAGSSSQPFTSPPEIETLSDKDNARCNGNSLELGEDTSNLSGSPEAPDEGSPTETKNFIAHSSVHHISNAYHGESSLDGSFSDEIPSSGEFSLEAQVRSMPEAGEHMERHKKDQTEREVSERVRQKGVKVQNFPEHEHLESVLPPQVHASVSQKEGYLQENKASHIISRANESHISPPTEQIKESNTNTNGYRSNATSRSPSKESLVSFYLASSDNEIPTHFPRDKRNFGRFSSLDTFGSSSPPMANYPINGTTYYAYDSSESSYDGNYDQVRERILHHPRKNKKDTDTSSIEMLGRNGLRGHARNHHWSQPAESSRYTSGNRKRLDGEEGFSRLPFPSRASVLKPQCPEPNKLDLLRTVCELQDQLNRMQLPEIGRYNNHNHFPLKRETYSGARHPHSYNARPSQVDVCPGQWDLPHYRPPQAGCSCPHCLSGTQDCRYSSHLPPRSSMCGAARPSTSSALQPVTDLKEKYLRHVRPVAGGAPMVSCYDCTELLLLPADFLLFNRKKYHRLKCGACRTILRFSLHGGTHIVPYVPEAIAPPPPLGNANTRDGPRHHQGPVRRAAEPVSCSDDGKVSSRGSFEAVEDRKMKSVLTGSWGEGGLGMGRWKVGPTSEIEELPSSPLHRLMGYSSPSQVLDN